MWGQSTLTALNGKLHLGSATITHPFHPKKDQTFQILKTRCVSGVETLILRGNYGGTFAVPREWTDIAAPSPQNNLILHLDSLISLAEIIKAIEQKIQEDNRHIGNQSQSCRLKVRQKLGNRGTRHAE